MVELGENRKTEVKMVGKKEGRILKYPWGEREDTVNWVDINPMINNNNGIFDIY